MKIIIVGAGEVGFHIAGRLALENKDEPRQSFFLDHLGMAKYWLKQFEGKYNGEQLEFNKDIDSISGATITAPSITAGIKSLSLLMVHLKETGKL